MGVINFLAKRVIGLLVRKMVREYFELKEKHPEKDPSEIYALILDSNRTYEKKKDSQFVFTRRNQIVDVSKFTSIRSLVHWMVMAEKADLRLSVAGHINIEQIVDKCLDRELGVRQKQNDRL